MKNLCILILVLTLLATMFSCKKFLDVNVDTDNATQTDPKNRLPAIEERVAITFYHYCLRSSYFSQYRTPNFTSKGSSLSYKGSWDWAPVNRVGEWRKHYYDVAGNINQMFMGASELGQANYTAVGKTLMAWSWLMATDVFGDMPYDEAFKGVVNPRYQSQDYIYDKIKELLEEAELYYASPVDIASMTIVEDPFYEGNINKWRAANKAILARWAIHQAPKNMAMYSEALVYVKEALNLGFEEMVWSYPNNIGNQYSQQPLSSLRPGSGSDFWDYDQNDFFAGSNYSVPTTFFTSNFIMPNPSIINPDGSVDTIIDLRIDKLLVTSKVSRDGITGTNTGNWNVKYYSTPYSEDATVNKSIPLQPSGKYVTSDYYPLAYEGSEAGYWHRQDIAMPVIMREELLFIKAEAEFQTGDVSSALTTMLEAIDFNAKRMGVNISKLEAYYRSREASGTFDIVDIMREKYKALYINPESYTDMRRHGWDARGVYPTLTYPTRVIYSPGEWCNRYYPDKETEVKYNRPMLIELGALSKSWIPKKMWWQQ